MQPVDEKLAMLRRAMVDRQLAARGITDHRVLEVMGELPREQFVPPDQRSAAYEDHPLPIGAGQTISQPYVVALMTQELDVRPGQRVLDVGTGSGYQAAVLARLAGRVYSVERLDDLAASAERTLAGLGIANVHIRVGDGTLGWPEMAPFDRICCGAGSPGIPPSWIGQLAEGGRIVAPVGDIDAQTLIRVDKTAGRLIHHRIADVRFVRLIGREGWSPPC